MNIRDGGTVSKESCALTQLSESMVGNPQQMLPPELRGDVPHGQQNKIRTSTDCKMLDVCSDASKTNQTSNSNHCPEVPSSHLRNNAPVFSTDSFRTDIDQVQAEGAAAFPAQHWPCGKKVGSEELVNLVHNNAAPNKKAPHSTVPTQPVISLSPGFQCSTLFKPGQPVAFLPSANLASSLCKITLPPGLGQIAALREATASQFQKDCPIPCSGSGSITPRLKTYPYQFSVGQGVTEKKTLSTSKGRCNHVSNAKGSKGVGEHKSTLSSAVSPTIALPAQQATQASAPLTHYTISPTAAICCSSALANITTQSRLLSLVEKCPSYRGIEKTSVAYVKPKTVSSTDEHNALCPAEARDVPLDLSSKSKRQKNIQEAQNSPTAMMEQCSFEPLQKNSYASKRPQTSSFGSVSNYALLPDTQRNGSAQRSTSKLSNHGLEPSGSREKGSSQGSLNNLPGTYVGVASPILASTLRSKNGKTAAFVEDVQMFAKQETISIIDQGEQLATNEKKTPITIKGNRQNRGGKSTSASTTTHAGQETSSKPLFTSKNLQSSRTSGGKPASPYSSPSKPSWHQSPFQGMSLQKQPAQSQASTKVKGSQSCDDKLYQKCELGTTNEKEEKWETTHSPLSNLETIVKQKAIETNKLTGETYCSRSSVASRKPEVVNLLSRSQNPVTVVTDSTPTGTSELQDTKTGNNSPPTSSAADNEQEATIALVSKEKCHEKEAKQKENFTSPNSELSTPKKRYSIKAEKNDSVPAPNSTAKIREKPTARQELSPKSNLESVSVIQNQITRKGEKKINGSKKDGDSRGKDSAIKPKKLKKKEKTSPESNKTAVLKKKLQMNDDCLTAVQAPTSKKKKNTSTADKSPLKESPLKEKPGSIPEGVPKIHKGMCSPVKSPLPPCSKPGSESSPVRRSVQVNPAPLIKADQSNKESNSQQMSSPRPKRGRRRTDDALLRDWSFASPPTPPPPPPPKSPSPPALPSPVFPLRRPRGRPRLNPLPEGGDTDNIKSAQVAEGGDQASAKKRKRCRNRKYQTGEYITDKEKEANRENEEKFVVREKEGTDVNFPLTATSPCEEPNPDLSPRKSLNTRSGTARLHDTPSTAECNDKPAGKRKFKSKHLCDTEEQKKLKIKRGLAGKRSTCPSTDEESPMAKKTFTAVSAPKESSPVPKKKGPGKNGIPESTPSRPVPPEVRRLIVNKNAGETLLQRAARLGYQEVVLYCLEKDVREVNRRDNAGYTALHEACARGWTNIVQMLLKHGADVNCSAQDGTRPIHDAVAADSLAAVWMLLNHGADPMLATYSGQTAVKLAQSPSMKTFLKDYFTDLEGRDDQDPGLQWEFYSSSLFETDQEACWDFLLSQAEEEDKEEWGEQGKEKDMDCLLFEFSSEPLLPCYHVQVSLTQGFCNWFLLMDVLKRLKVSARIFRARYPQFEIVNVTRGELWRQVSVSQTCVAPDELRPVVEEEEEEIVELVRCIPELQGLLGSSIHLLQEDDSDDAQQSERASATNSDVLR